MKTEQKKVSPSYLLLDPNNYRFHDLSTYKPVANRARYAEPGVQEKALQLLQTTDSFDLSALRDSILTNGFVPLEQIVVEKFDEVDGNPRYLVIEGNRRVASVKTLLRDYEAGAADLPQNILKSIEALPVIEIIGTDEERKDYQQTLMAIRHVAGIREWGPYQQAKLVVELYEKLNQGFGPVAQQIGISAKEVARRYRASKALQQMEDDDEFGEYASPRLYSFFHEAVSQPKVREWLKFSDQSYSAEDAEARKSFYELLSPRIVDGERLQPKLQNANRQVRQLKDIVDKPIPLKILNDPERSFEEAVRAADEETILDDAELLERSLAVAHHTLSEPGIDAWLSPSPKAEELWAKLVDLVNKIQPIMGTK